MTAPTHKAIISDLFEQIEAELTMALHAVYEEERAGHVKVALERLRELRDGVKRHE